MPSDNLDNRYKVIIALLGILGAILTVITATLSLYTSRIEQQMVELQATLSSSPAAESTQQAPQPDDTDTIFLPLPTFTADEQVNADALPLRSGAPVFTSVSTQRQTRGAGVVVIVYLSFTDPDNDVVSLAWHLVHTDATWMRLPPGNLQGYQRDNLEVAFNCYDRPFTATVYGVLIDRQNNEARTDDIMLDCT